MGDIADSIIDGEFDCITGEYLGSGVWYPRTLTGNHKQTPAEKKIASIRKEIAILVKNGTAIEEARKQMNLKYGKGWRERGLISNSDNQWSDEDLK